MGLSPEEVLAGQASGGSSDTGGPIANPLAGSSQPTPSAPTSAPEIAPNPAGPGEGPLSGMGISGLPPAPPKGSGVSEDLRTQFMRNADSIIKNASDPSAPGAWARALVGGVQSTLAGVGNIGVVPHGAGALYGVGKVMQANQEQDNKQKAAEATAKQQKFENDYKMQELQLRKDAQNWSGLLNDVAVQKAFRSSTQEAQDEMYNKIYAPWKKAETESGAQVVREGMTSDELQDLAKEHKAADDPNGTHWLSGQLRHQDGWKDVTDANGDVVPQLDPRTGKPSGLPQRQATYSLMTYGEPMTVNKDIAAQAKKYLDKDFKEGDVLQPQDAALLKSQIGKAVVDEHAADELALQSGTTKEKLSELQQKSDYREAGKVFNPWLDDAKGDPGLALKNMQIAAGETDANGQLTDHAQAVKKQYDTVVSGMGDQIIKSSIDTFGKEEIERVKSNLKDASNKDKAQGNTALTGRPYLDSIQDPGERALISELGTGRMAASRMEYLIARKPGVAQELALAFPGLDTGKIGQYIDASKKFSSGTIANQINAAGTGFMHLKALMEDNGKEGSLVAGPAYAQRQADLNDASMELARFLAGGNAPTEHDIAGARETLSPSTWRGLIAGENPTDFLNDAVMAQAERLHEKVEQYKGEWKDALPSATWDRPMPGWQQANQDAYDFVRNRGKVPAQTFSVAIPNGPSITFPTQDAANKFKAAHGIN